MNAPPSAILGKSVSNDLDFCIRSKYQPVTYSRPRIEQNAILTRLPKDAKLGVGTWQAP
jgi:hypothetical protein